MPVMMGNFKKIISYFVTHNCIQNAVFLSVKLVIYFTWPHVFWL